MFPDLPVVAARAIDCALVCPVSLGRIILHILYTLLLITAGNSAMRLNNSAAGNDKNYIYSAMNYILSV